MKSKSFTIKTDPVKVRKPMSKPSRPIDKAGYSRKQKHKASELNELR